MQASVQWQLLELCNALQLFMRFTQGSLIVPRAENLTSQARISQACNRAAAFAGRITFVALNVRLSNPLSQRIEAALHASR